MNYFPWTAKGAAFYELPGAGPFQVAPIARLQAAEYLPAEGLVRLTGLCHDLQGGYRFLISRAAARQFVEAHESASALPLTPFAQTQTIAIPYSPPGPPFRPLLSCLGLIYVGQEDCRVVGFANQREQVLGVAMTAQAYAEFLSEFKTAEKMLARK